MWKNNGKGSRRGYGSGEKSEKVKDLGIHEFAWIFCWCSEKKLQKLKWKFGCEEDGEIYTCQQNITFFKKC